MPVKTKKTVSKVGSPRAAKGTRRSREELLNRIVRAARGEFKRHGFAGATTPSIARKAQVTETQIFRYFGSKSNLFRETIFKPLDQHLLKFTNDQSGRLSKLARQERSVRYTTELQHFITEHAEMLSSLVFNQQYDAKGGRGVAKINSLNGYFEHCAGFMTKAMLKKPQVEPKVMVRVTFAAVLGCVMFKDWIFPAGLARNEKITAAINTFILEGLSANA